MSSETVRALRGLLWAALCICALTFHLPHASSQDGGDAAYRELIEQALSEFKHKNWPEARVLFVRAHELNPNARTSRGMGIVSFEMRDYLSAVVNLRAALEDTRQPLTEAQRKECDALLTRARTYVGVFALKVEPEDAELTLDGAAITRDEQGRLMVPFGEHTVTARAPGYQEASTKLVVQGGERGEVSLRLQKEGTPQVDAAPSVREEPSNVPAPAVVTKQSAPAQPAKNTPSESRFIGGGLKYTWVALGASAAFGATAAVMWTLGQNKLDDLDAKCRDRAGSNPCTRDNTSTNNIERYELGTNVALGLSAAAFGAAAVLMALEWPRERNVSIGLGNKSLVLRGAF